MKIAITGDNHLSHCASVTDQIIYPLQEAQIDALIIGGDTEEVLMFPRPVVQDALKVLFTSFKNTYHIMGNHDLFSDPPFTPPVAFEKALKKIPYGTPLQTSWSDDKTIIQLEDNILIGSIGFPDFLHKDLHFPPAYFNFRYPTVDGTYMDLRKGWLEYLPPIHNGFQKKLDKVGEYKEAKNVIIVTHYNIFDGAYRVTCEEISAYFYNRTMGEMVLECAKKNPDLTFISLSFHGHEYNRGGFVQEGLNVWTCGMKASYHEQDYFVFQTSPLILP